MNWIRYSNPFAVRQASDQVCISRAQRDMHVVGEALGLAVGVPFGTWAALNSTLPGPARLAGAGLAIGSLVFDGWLLASYTRNQVR